MRPEPFVLPQAFGRVDRSGGGGGERRETLWDTLRQKGGGDENRRRGVRTSVQPLDRARRKEGGKKVKKRS